VGVVEGVVAIDGKTVRGSQDGPNTALHMISAYATGSGLCLAQEGVCGKGKEIEGIKALLETLTLKGSIVTMDALGCQTEIARKILERGDYYSDTIKLAIIDLKGNVERSNDEGNEICYRPYGRGTPIRARCGY
jgi:hypothetical protein